MKSRFLFSLGLGFGSVLAQDAVFEPVDFNVTAALLKNGVDISSISELSNVVAKRSVSSQCAVAVSSSILSLSTHQLTLSAVQIPQVFVRRQSPYD